MLSRVETLHSIIQNYKAIQAALVAQPGAAIRPASAVEAVIVRAAFRHEPDAEVASQRKELGEAGIGNRSISKQPKPFITELAVGDFDKAPVIPLVFSHFDAALANDLIRHAAPVCCRVDLVDCVHNFPLD